MRATRTSEPIAGESLAHPAGAGRLVVLRTAEQSDGRAVSVEAVCEPGPPGVPERSFAGHEVIFELLEGTLSVGVNGSTRRLRPGQCLRLAPGTPHRIWVEARDRSARFLWEMRPAPAGADYLDLVFGRGPGQEPERECTDQPEEEDHVQPD